MGLAAFKMSQVWGPDTVLISLYYATSGVVFPMDLAPQWLQHFASWTPTYYMVSFPTLTMMGRYTESQFQMYAGRGLFVIAVLSLIIAAAWNRGIKTFEAVGI